MNESHDFETLPATGWEGGTWWNQHVREDKTWFIEIAFRAPTGDQLKFFALDQDYDGWIISTDDYLDTAESIDTEWMASVERIP
jgi:hypothetical protein